MNSHCFSTDLAANSYVVRRIKRNLDICFSWILAKTLLNRNGKFPINGKIRPYLFCWKRYDRTTKLKLTLKSLPMGSVFQSRAQSWSHLKQKQSIIIKESACKLLTFLQIWPNLLIWPNLKKESNWTVPQFDVDYAGWWFYDISLFTNVMSTPDLTLDANVKAPLVWGIDQIYRNAASGYI